MKRTTALPLGLGLTLSLSLCLCGCGNTATSQVAGAEQQIVYAYVLEVNDQARTLMVDPVEMVDANDSQRLGQLHLSTADISGDRFAYNERRDPQLYALDREADFDFGDANGNTGAGNNDGTQIGFNSYGLMQNGSYTQQDGTVGRGSFSSDSSDGNGNNGGGNDNGSGNNGGGGNGGGGGNNGNAGSLSGVGSEGNVGEQGDMGATGSLATGDNNGAGGNGGNTGNSGNTGNGGNTGNTGANGAAGTANGLGGSNNGNMDAQGMGYGSGTASEANNGVNVSSASNGAALQQGNSYNQVNGGMFNAFSDDYDRINAYLRQYDDLLCRLSVEGDTVTALSVCTADNMD